MTLDEWQWKQYRADAKKHGARVVRVGDRVTVIADRGGSGWTFTWSGETTLLDGDA